MEINIQTKKAKHEELLSALTEKYKSRFPDEVELTYDGPSDWAQWETQLPRILFLSKEAHSGYHPSVPSEVNNSFSSNIWRWQYAIRSLYTNRSVTPAYPITIPPKSTLDSVAIVEVKKLDENTKVSIYKEIYEYTKADGELLKKQIDLLDPHIILCCNTGDAYGDYIDTTDWQSLIEVEKCGCYKQSNRLIIDFYHPSNQRQSPRTDTELFELLNQLLNSGEVFNEFTWH